MTADEQIDRLDAERERFFNEHPDEHGILRISNDFFRACTMMRWKDHNWSMKEEEVSAIMNGNEEQRRIALMSFLWPQMISHVEFVPGVEFLEILPDPNADQEPEIEE